MLAHFLVHVFDVEGARLLSLLGDRAAEWRVVRETSSFMRHAVAAAIACLFGDGPYAVVFQGPQGSLGAEHYLCTGEFLGYEVAPGGPSEGVASGSVSASLVGSSLHCSLSLVFVH